MPRAVGLGHGVFGEPRMLFAVLCAARVGPQLTRSRGAQGGRWVANVPAYSAPRAKHRTRRRRRLLWT